MKKDINNMIEAFELELEMKFIDFENRINEIFSNFLKNYE